MKVVILGGGLAGCTMGYLLCREGYEVIIVEKEMQLGGMCRTFYKDSLGYEIGPHIIYTNSKETISFIKRFIDIVPNALYLGTQIDGEILSYPLHIDDIAKLKDSDKVINELTHLNSNEPNYTNFETYMTSTVGKTLYELFYYNYTKKFWNIEPQRLSSSWAKTRKSQLVLRKDKDKSAFQVKYQGYPKTDYNDLITKLSKSCKVVRGTVENFIGEPIVNGEHIKGDFYINTLSLDDLFSQRFGRLSYRGIKQEIEILNQEHYFKDYAWVYYPDNGFDYTRICEYKHINLKSNPRTLIAKELPTDAKHYPFYSQETENIFNKYIEYLSGFNNLVSLGRLGLYIYTTMGVTIRMCFEIKNLIKSYAKLDKEQKNKEHMKIRAIAEKGE
ncbi:MAG: UDP-galactopyranose mutase [Candidatus Omnitrophota bacterium]|nr:UDP-galactopyranose mutase [Candidatus Omnitrophota bacterium]